MHAKKHQEIKTFWIDADILCYHLKNFLLLENTFILTKMVADHNFNFMWF